MSAPRRAAALVALLGALFLLGGAGSASAHSAVRDSDPREGVVLQSAPKQVTMTFTEAVGVTDDSFRVLSPENRRVNEGDTKHVPGRSDAVRVRLQDGLADGTYTVAWRVVSADSHPISGAFTFSIGEPSATTAAVPVEPAVNPASGALYDIARYAAYAAVALLVGVVTFVLVCRPPSAAPLRGLLRAGWWTLLATTVALLFLRGPYERGTGPSTLLDPELFENTLNSRPGWALLARLVLLAGAAVFVVRLVPLVSLVSLVRFGRADAGARPGSGPTSGSVPDADSVSGAEVVSDADSDVDVESAAEPRTVPDPAVAPKPVVLVVGALLGLGLAGTWAAAEHASAGIQVPVAMTSSVLHLLAMAVWLGGLTALLTTFHRSTTPLSTDSVTRFSRLAFASVTVLVVTGVYQSWRGLGSWDALFDTSYGRLLVAKTCAVVVLLVAAGFSRRWTARLTGAEAGAGAGAGASSAKAEVEASVAAPSTVPAQALEKVGAAARTGGGGGGSADSDAGSDSDADTGSSSSSGSGSGSGSGDSTSSAAGNGSGPDSASVSDSASGAEPGAEGAAGAARHRSLRRSVLAEVVVGVLVLVITTILTGTQPGRAETETAAAANTSVAADQPAASTLLIPFDVGTPGGRGKVQVVLEPARVGENTVEAVIIGPDGGVATVPEIRLSFTLPSQDIGPIDAQLTDQGGYWGTRSLQLPIPGTWTMKVTIRTSDIDQVSETRRVKIVR